MSLSSEVVIVITKGIIIDNVEFSKGDRYNCYGFINKHSYSGAPCAVIIKGGEFILVPLSYIKPAP